MKVSARKKIEYAVKDGAADEALAPLMQELIDEKGLDTTPQEWALDNYRPLRRAAYPDRDTIIDALLKLHSGIPEIEAEGRIEIDAIFQLVQDVRTRFVKPEVPIPMEATEPEPEPEPAEPKL